MSLSIAKSMLAKLLSMENLTVTQSASAKTASFNLKDRVLTLPLLKAMEDAESVHYDGFIIHEIAHALFSDPDRYMELAKKYGGSITNILEDVRINRLVVDMYPGAKRIYVKHYGKLFDGGFYGACHNTVNALPFYDKVNVHYKVGSYAGVEFGGEELKFVPMLDKLRTMDELEELLKLLAEQKKKQEEESNDEGDSSPSEEESEGESESDPTPNFPEEDDSEGEAESSESDESEDEGEDESESSAEGDDGEEGDEEEESECEEDSADSDDSEGGESTDSEEDPIDFSEPETQDEFDKKFEEEFFDNSSQHIKVRHLGSVKGWEDLIIGYKDYYSKIVTPKYKVGLDRIDDGFGDSSGFARASESYKKFEASIKSDVGYFVKQFESKKSAQEFQKTKTRKTGTLDMRLINKYMFTDNLFKSNEIKPEGKNHGLMIMLDFSGSMRGINLDSTIKQVLIITAFAKRIGIPFEVYAFADINSDLVGRYGRRHEEFTDVPAGVDKAFVSSDAMFYNILSSKMTKAEFIKAREMMFIGSDMDSAVRYYDILDTYNGTPLAASLLLLSEVAEDFIKKNQVEIPTIMILTDGEGNSGYDLGRNNDRLIDAKTKKEYVIGIKDTNGRYHYRWRAEEEYLYQILKDRTGANVVGYFIGDSRSVKRDMRNKLAVSGINYSDHGRTIAAAFRNKGVVTIPFMGCDSYIYMQASRYSNNEVKIADGSAKAFKSAMVSKKAGRIFADTLMGIVA